MGNFFGKKDESTSIDTIRQSSLPLRTTSQITSPLTRTVASPTSSGAGAPSYSNVYSQSVYNAPKVIPSPSYQQRPLAPQPLSNLNSRSSIKTSSPPPIVDVPVKHDVNGYLLTASKSDVLLDGNATIKIDIPSNLRVDKFVMRVCPQYNSNQGCSIEMCFRFHVCFYWIIGNCSRAPCKFDHAFDSQHNFQLSQPFLLRRFTLEGLKQCLNRNAFKYKHLMDDAKDHICSQNVLKSCKQNPCRHMHHQNSFLWKLDLKGLNTLPYSISNVLEEKFCQVEEEFTISIRKDSRELRQNLLAPLCTVNFEIMRLQSGQKSIQLSRLSTPPDVIESKYVATRWIWYWQDDNDKFCQYQHAIVNDFFVIPFCDYLEIEYQKDSVQSFKCTIGRFKYTIDFKQMVQINLDTSKVRCIKSRPHLRIKSQNSWQEETNFFTAWKEIPKNLPFLKVEICPPSPELDMVLLMLRSSMPLLKLKKLERIQNVELWTAYQLKKKQMQTLLGGMGNLHEQYMFHGTKFSVIDKVCSDNFDWRLFGTSVGNVCGKGTYFASDANLSNHYAQPDNVGYKCMFVAFVLVGTSTVGNSDMVYPPINPLTKRCFDTTVNSTHNPTIFVKYNSDEYYPAYCVHYSA